MIRIDSPSDLLSDLYAIELYLKTVIFASPTKILIYEPHHEKTGFLLMRKGRRRAACFRYTDSTIPILPKSEISSF